MNKLQTIAVSTALTLGLASLSLPSIAAENTAPLMKLQPVKMQQCKKHYKHRRHHAWRKPVTASWRRALQPNRVLSVDDARTVAQAAIILSGDRNTSIQDIKPMTTKRGKQVFLIRLTNTQTKENKTLMMNTQNGRLFNVTHKGKFANEKQ